jgi:hypothetical protein
LMALSDVRTSVAPAFPGRHVSAREKMKRVITRRRTARLTVTSPFRLGRKVHTRSFQIAGGRLARASAPALDPSVKARRVPAIAVRCGKGLHVTKLRIPPTTWAETGTQWASSLARNETTLPGSGRAA